MNLAKKINEVWALLNETALLLNRTAVQSRFANQLAVLRSQLQHVPPSPAILLGVNTALTEMRKHLRLAGYDLSKGKYTLIFDGFRNDDATVEGFGRLVLFIEKGGAFYWKTGEENHMMLATMLENVLGKNPALSIIDMHYLWYARTKTTLTLSGSATETGEDYERLKAMGNGDSLLFLSRLKGLC